MDGWLTCCRGTDTLAGRRQGTRASEDLSRERTVGSARWCVWVDVDVDAHPRVMVAARHRVHPKASPFSDCRSHSHSHPYSHPQSILPRPCPFVLPVLHLPARAPPTAEPPTHPGPSTTGQAYPVLLAPIVLGCGTKNTKVISIAVGALQRLSGVRGAITEVRHAERGRASGTERDPG